MKKEELLKAVDALKAEIEKKPEDKVAEKLDEILKAIQALPWYPYHVCPPCTLPHYSSWGGTVWTYPSSITVSGGAGTMTTGTTWTDQNVSLT